MLPRDLDVSARRRARFCMQLNALSPLQRYDVLDSIALRFAIREYRGQRAVWTRTGTWGVELRGYNCGSFYLQSFV